MCAMASWERSTVLAMATKTTARSELEPHFDAGGLGDCAHGNGGLAVDYDLTH